MARLFFSTLTDAEVLELLEEAERAVASGGTYISGNAGDVGWSKFREIPAAELVVKLQRELALRGHEDYPPEDYIGANRSRVRFS